MPSGPAASDLNRGYTYRETVPHDAHRERLADFLARRFPHSSREEWVRRIIQGRVQVNGKPAGPDQALRPGEMVLWNRPPWIEPEAPRCFAVLHEDASLLAVAKPAGLPTLPGAGYLLNSLLSVVRERYPDASPAHRLGRWTSGLVLFARTKEAMRNLSAGFRSRTILKVYRTLAEGDPRPDAFPIDTAIGPVRHRVLGTVHGARPGGSRAHSDVRVLRRLRGRFLADVTIRTGRPHQVRIHMAAAGFPLAGDPLYPAGGVPDPDTTALPGDPGYRLHAMELEFPHPETGHPIRLDCRPPADLRL